MDREIFQKKLQMFMAEKGLSGCTPETVKEYFAEDALSEEQIAMIMAYAGEVREEAKLSEEEHAYLEDYELFLEVIDPEEPGEKELLFEKLHQGNEFVKERLTSLYLKVVPQEAMKIRRGSLFLGDLIQEGNIGLAMGINAAVGSRNPHEVILQHIRAEMNHAVEKADSSDRIDQEMIGKVRALDESLTKLEKDLGRKVYLEEIAADMGITEEEVKEIIKLTGEEVKENDQV